MEMQLSSLIEKIKEEGILEAKKKSEEIINQAQERKKAIIQDAEKKAGFIIKEAEGKAENLKVNSHKAITLSVRDATLSLKEGIKNLFEGILKKEIQRTFSNNFIPELIFKIVTAWPKNVKADLDILLSHQDKERLGELVFAKLKSELSSGITFKVSPKINKGLYIGTKGDDFYYDFSDEAILEILKEYLRPFIVKIIESKNG